MLNDLLVNLSWSAPLALLAGVALGVFYWKRNSTQHRWYAGFLIAALAIETVARGMMYSKVGNNLYLLSFSAFFEFVFFTVLYVGFLHSHRRRWLYAILPLFALYLAYNMFHLSTVLALPDFQLYDRLIADALVLLLSLLFVKDVLLADQIPPRENRITNVFVLIYVIIDLFMSLTSNFMVNETPTPVLLLWFVRLLAQVGLYLNLAYAIWQNGKMQKPSLAG